MGLDRFRAILNIQKNNRPSPRAPAMPPTTTPPIAPDVMLFPELCGSEDAAGPPRTLVDVSELSADEAIEESLVPPLVVSLTLEEAVAVSVLKLEVLESTFETPMN